MLSKDVHMHPYKAQTRHKLSEDDYGRRLAFCRRVQEMVAAEILDLKNINFSDESQFYVMSKPNRQNFRKWSTTKPEFQVSTLLHSAKVTGVD